MVDVNEKAVHHRARGTLVAGLAAGLLVMALALVSGARADLNVAPLDLDAVTIIDGVATITGSVGDAAADLQINGVPVNVDALGNFTALVDVDRNVVAFSLLNDLGKSTTIEIPVNVLVENGGEGVLNDLLGAGITIDVPKEGFQSIDGNGPIVSGTILNDAPLHSATVNGIDILRGLGPNGGFSVALPASSAPPSQSNVTFVVVDRRGVSQTSTFRATRISSVIRTRSSASVSAAGARGIVIAKLRFDKASLRSIKRFVVSVTVKDRRGYLIRGAALRLSGSPSRYLATGAVRAGFTNRSGQARFTYRLRPSAFSTCGCKQLAVTVRASTPRTATKRMAALRLPALAG